MAPLLTAASPPPAESQSHRAGREPTRRSRQSLLDPDSGVSVVSADLLPARTRPADK